MTALRARCDARSSLECCTSRRTRRGRPGEVIYVSVRRVQPGSAHATAPARQRRGTSVAEGVRLVDVLVENRAGHVASRLHNHLWPTTFVQDTNLASLVAEIRRALDDARRSQVRAHGPALRVLVYRCAGRGRRRGTRTRLGHWLIWDTRQIALSDGENVIGRAPDATAWIDALGVSRTHARITVSDSDATIEDLGSKNGTFVHGERITKRRPLADGDQIRLGSVVITLRIPQAVGSTDTVSAVVSVRGQRSRHGAD